MKYAVSGRLPAHGYNFDESKHPAYLKLKRISLPNPKSQGVKSYGRIS